MECHDMLKLNVVFTNDPIIWIMRKYSEDNNNNGNNIYI